MSKMTEEEELFEEDAFPEETETVPEQPELKRQSHREDLKQRVNCPDCGRQVSLHCLRHTNRCKKKEEKPPEPENRPKQKTPRALRAK